MCWNCPAIVWLLSSIASLTVLSRFLLCVACSRLQTAISCIPSMVPCVSVSSMLMSPVITSSESVTVCLPLSIVSVRLLKSLATDLKMSILGYLLSCRSCPESESPLPLLLRCSFGCRGSVFAALVLL